jgi:hypothetical protein
MTHKKAITFNDPFLLHKKGSLDLEALGTYGLQISSRNEVLRCVH